MTPAMYDLLRLIGRERCLARRRLHAATLAGLQAREFVEVHKGWVELSRLGHLIVLGLEAEELMRRRPLRADRTGGGPLVEIQELESETIELCTCGAFGGALHQRGCIMCRHAGEEVAS